MNVGKSSSFMAKLSVLREGLRLVRERGLRNVEVEIDVESIIKAIKSGNPNGQSDNVLVHDCMRLLESETFKDFFPHPPER